MTGGGNATISLSPPYRLIEWNNPLGHFHLMQPLFIFGIARSGTNLLCRMLNRHPAVELALDPFMPLFKSLRNRIVEECSDAQLKGTFDPRSAFEDYYFNPRGAATIDLLAAATPDYPFREGDEAELRNAVAARANLESPALAGRLMQATGADYRTFLESALDIIAQSNEGADNLWCGSKEVWTVDFLPLLARMYPAARFFVIERDPRAIVASLLEMARKDSSQSAHFVSYARHWRKFVVQSRALASVPEIADRVRIVTYEDLVSRPEDEAQRICAQLALDFVPEMLDVSAEGWIGNSSYGGNDGIYGLSLGQWRETLSHEVMQAIEFYCAPEMTLTAYVPLTDAAGRITPALLRTVRDAANSSGSWRSDSGQATNDMGGELMRYALLDSPDDFDDQIVRECFLYRQAYQDIRERARNGRT